MSEWFKELVLKTSDPATGHGFESHPLRHVGLPLQVTALPPCREGRGVHLLRRPPFRREAALRGEGDAYTAACYLHELIEIQLFARF